MNLLLASLHYLALAIGFSSLILRGIRMKEALSGGSLNNVFVADNFWGLSALLWISTGLLRAFAGFEKGTDYYLNSHWFWLKMVLFGFVFAFELLPMITLIRWRISKKSLLDGPTDRALFERFTLLNRLQVILILLIPFAAVFMARGA